MDELIQKHAARMQAMYDNRTAGDHSMSGILSEFLEEIVSSCYAISMINRRHEPLCPSAPHKDTQGLTTDEALQMLRDKLTGGLT